MTATHQAPAKLRHLLIALVLLATGLTGWAGSATAQSPVAQEPIKVVKIFQRLCPADVDPSAGTWQQARTSCPDAVEGLVFTLTSRDPSYVIPLVVNALGETEWHEVPFGQAYTISHPDAVEYGPAWVSCRFDMNRDPSIPGTERIFQAPDNVIDIGGSEPMLATYGEVECYWFDRPSTAGVQAEPDADVSNASEEASTENAGVEAAAAASPESSTLALTGNGARLDMRVWGCPFHFDAMATPVEQLMSFCQQDRTASTPFTINGAAPPNGSLTGITVPYGSVTIRQEAVGTYATLRTFCYTQPATASHGPLNASMEAPFTPESNDRASVTLTVAPGEAIDCIWFMGVVTTQDLGSLLVTAYQCPDGYNTQTGGLTDLLTTCHTPQAGAYFELQQPGALSGNTTDANGYQGFVNYTPRTYVLAETLPLGWATERVFCRSTQADDWNHPTDSYVEQTVRNKSDISVTLTAHWELDCYWFDSKGVDNAYLDITAWSCPLNFSPSATTPRNTFAQQCSVGVTGAEFDVSRGLGYESSASSTDGYAYFQEPVPPGALDVREDGPTTHRFVRAFCGDAPFVGIGAIPTTWTRYTQPQLTFPGRVNYQIVCEFYFIPLSTAVEAAASPDASSAEDASAALPAEASPTVDPSAASDEESADAAPAPTPTTISGQSGDASSDSTSTQPPADASATLLLHLHTCPTGYDVYAEQADPALDCAPASGPPTVTVNGAASQTSADGTAGWMEVPAGVAQIDAAPGAFLGVCSSNLRAIPADAVVPYGFAGPNGTVGVSLMAGETLTCDWYSALDAASGSVTVTLFSCPGPTVIEAQCDAAPGPASVQFAPVDGADAAFTMEIDESGTGQASATGAYQIVSFPDGTCSIESDAFDATGALVIDPGATVEVRMYLCAQSS